MTWKLGDPAECCVCGKTVESYAYHQRLAVAICGRCPLTDVKGEDVSMHAMYFVNAKRYF